jgi:hypothetical protein
VFDSYSAIGNHSIFRFLLGAEFATTRLLVWHRDIDTLKREADKPRSCSNSLPLGSG